MASKYDERANRVKLEKLLAQAHDIVNRMPPTAETQVIYDSTLKAYSAVRAAQRKYGER